MKYPSCYWIPIFVFRIAAGLKSYFEKWGEVSDCVIMQDPITKRPRYVRKVQKFLHTLVLKKCTSSCFILFLQRIWFCNIQRCHCSAGCCHAGSSYARQQNSWFLTLWPYYIYSIQSSIVPGILDHCCNDMSIALCCRLIPNQPLRSLPLHRYVLLLCS